MSKPIYTPILNAKQGEFDALDHIRTETNKAIFPLFELPIFSDEFLKRKKYENEPTPKRLFVADTLSKIISARSNEPFMLDIFKWSPDSTLESGEHVLNFSYNYLASRNANVTTVVGYDRWEDIQYVKALESIRVKSDSFCIRLESYAFEDMYDEDHFSEILHDILDTLQLTPSKCHVILDLGDVSSTSVVEICEKVERAYGLIRPLGFTRVSMAGCSLTSFITDMVPEQDSSEVILRREYVAWKSLRNTADIGFGDYGVVSPNSAEIRTPHANGKIRYTISDNYFVARGHSRMHGNKGAQMYDLSETVISSGFYLGSSFSWGDRRIEDCANRLLKGSLKDWVAIDTSHHIQFATMSVLEFEKQLLLNRTTARL
ncbi:beta family protein [Bowmanella pacifica]|uniref:Beta protein n=1 Tax=Bowmanella pacifica TaxID=502051 RepID=A0A917YYQ9_9ALTE|nr:beta family protein [Bowmanella pacifica]GGO68221.1 hypothetical protein GCM10010982_16630 [Bowmanella pacifica]